jgi:transcriptional regulator with XRE-family HTH domain
MKDQILKIIEAEGLTPAKFADEIGVQRSSISHIISGRNKPSYDFIIKIIDRFRGINTEWLLTGKGSMIKSSEMENNPKKTLFDTENIENKIEKIANINIDSQNNSTPEDIDNTKKPEYHNKIKSSGNESYNVNVTNVNNDNFILIFYNDGTYRRYSRRE